MKCKVCRTEWRLGNNNRIPRNCPICETELFSTKIYAETEMVGELLFTLLQIGGPEIFKNPERALTEAIKLLPQEGIKGDPDYLEKIFTQGMGRNIYKWLRKKPQKEQIRRYIEKSSMVVEKEDLCSSLYFLYCIDIDEGDNLEDSEYYLNVFNNSTDKEKKKKALMKALKYANSRNRNDILWILSDYEYEINDTDFENHLSELAECQDEKATLRLVKVYEQGLKVPKNRKKAFEILKTHESMKSGEILYQLARYYMLGWAEEKNRDLAKVLLERAGSAGNTKADYQLYNLYKEDDPDKAFAFLAKSQKEDYLPAVHEYALHLLYGIGVKRDAAKALLMLEENAKRGYSSSKEKLRILGLSSKSKDMNVDNFSKERYAEEPDSSDRKTAFSDEYQKSKAAFIQALQEKCEIENEPVDGKIECLYIGEINRPRWGYVSAKGETFLQILAEDIKIDKDINEMTRITFVAEKKGYVILSKETVEEIGSATKSLMQCLEKMKQQVHWKMLPELITDVIISKTGEDIVVVSGLASAHHEK